MASRGSSSSTDRRSFVSFDAGGAGQGQTGCFLASSHGHIGGDSAWLLPAVVKLEESDEEGTRGRSQQLAVRDNGTPTSSAGTYEDGTQMLDDVRSVESFGASAGSSEPVGQRWATDDLLEAMNTALSEGSSVQYLDFLLRAVESHARALRFACEAARRELRRREAARQSRSTKVKREKEEREASRSRSSQHKAPSSQSGRSPVRERENDDTAFRQIQGCLTQLRTWERRASAAVRQTMHPL